MDADAELKEINGKCRHLPEVLAVRVNIYDGMMQVFSKKLALCDPEDVQGWIDWANATRWSESIEAAKSILLEVVKKHPHEPLVYYDLACYECQLGDLLRSMKHLKKAFKQDPEYRIYALEDEDLMPMWMMLED